MALETVSISNFESKSLSTDRAAYEVSSAILIDDLGKCDLGSERISLVILEGNEGVHSLVNVRPSVRACGR